MLMTQLFLQIGIISFSGFLKSTAGDESNIGANCPKTSNGTVKAGNLWDIEQYILMEARARQRLRSAVASQTIRWPNGRVPYRITNHFNTEQVKLIHGAIEELNNKTNIRFQPATGTDKDIVEITSAGSGCNSQLGRVGGVQQVNLQKPNCMYHCIIVHELMHSLGFFHEHVRPDRDLYLKIHWENIDKKHHGLFLKWTLMEDFNVGYDYNSTMHYGPHLLSCNGQPTFSTINPVGVKAGTSMHLSDKDVLKINRMYPRWSG